MTKALTTLKKETYPIDDRHELIFHAFGPCIRKCGCEDASGVWIADLVEFLPIKKSMQTNMDLKKLKCSEYALVELVIFKQSYLGMYQDNGIFLRNGPYGPYIEWGDTKKTATEDRIGSLTYEDAIQIITEEKPKESIDSKFLRALTDAMSVRTGQYGPYVYYKTTTMKMPKFVNIKTFSHDVLTCDSNILISWVLDEVNKPKPGRGGRGRGGRSGRGRS
jgi:DNA topoisomerase-1